MSLSKQGVAHRVLVFLVIVGVVVFGVSLVGCGSMDGLVGDGLDGALDRAVSGAIEQKFANLDDELLFTVSYTQVFFMGGFWSDEHDFEETQGVVWEIDSLEPEGRVRYTAERALLRNNPDGTRWWYMNYADEEMTAEYELLTNEELMPLEVYLKDPETGEIRHLEFEYEEGESFSEQAEDSDDYEEIEDTGVGAVVYLTPDEYDRYTTSRVRRTVGAGTFEADHIQYELVDGETGEDYLYQWWAVEDGVPGALIEYLWEDRSENTTVRGELVSVKKGYVPTLKPDLF
jgi:hypothetical protein